MVTILPSIALDSCEDILTEVDSLLHLFVSHKLGHPSCQLLGEAQVVVKDDVNGTIGHPKCQRKVLYCNTAVLFHRGHDSRDNILTHLCFLHIEMPLVFCCFPCLNFLK